jgi:hypothetical protein
MRSIRLWQGLALAVIIGAALLGAGVFGLGLAIHHGVVEPPRLDLRHAQIRIVAYSTHYPDCPPYSLCPRHFVGSPQEYYVVWSIYEPPTFVEPYGRTAHRLLVVPLQRRSGRSSNATMLGTRIFCSPS